MDRTDILIAGAGISGLVAARNLRRGGWEVTILEARDRTGGRILSVPKDGLVLEAGPEFIHGHLRETISLLNEFRIPFVKTRGKMYRARGGRFTEQNDPVPGWDGLIREMKAVTTDLPFKQFLDERFSGERNRALRDSAIHFAEGFDLADVHRASTLSLIREWEREGSEQFRIPGGYGQLTGMLAKEFVSSGGKIVLGRQINKVDWKKDDVLVSTAGHHQYAAGKIVVSLPPGPFSHGQDGYTPLVFAPDIPEKRAALQQIGFGTVVKILLIWKTAFWKTFIPDALFVFSDQDIPTWWTQNPADSGVLTGWVGGPAAEKLAALPDKELLNKAMENLSAIFGLAKQELYAQLETAVCFNWKNEKFTQGAYSYTLSGQAKARACWREPVDDTLYFCGEAAYEGPHPGTVEAAIASGMETAGKIMATAGPHSIKGVRSKLVEKKAEN